MLNLFKTRQVTLMGTYFGSHPRFPKTAKNLVVIARNKGITIKNFKTWGIITWEEVKSFDYTGEISNGSFEATLATTGGDLVIQLQSLHANKNAGYDLMSASSKQNKLNKFKRFVIEHQRSLVRN